MKKNIIILFLGTLLAQFDIEGRWHLVGYEDAVMYQFVDNEPFANAGYKYTIYSIFYLYCISYIKEHNLIYGLNT